jgi:fatty-acyl-CoA synthase
MPGNVVLKPDLSALLETGSTEQGWIARCGSVPLGYYKDEAKTAKTFPVVGGVYSVRRSCRHRRASPAGRVRPRSTPGEKIFAEEVEHALKHHPSVYDAVVVGTPSERWGQQVTAIVKLREGERPSEDALRETARAHIAPFKLPKVFLFVDEIVRSPSGKADYRWAKATALAKLQAS